MAINYYSVTTRMSRIFYNKLVMLMFVSCMPLFLAARHQGGVISCQSPEKSQIIFSGNSQSSAEVSAITQSWQLPPDRGCMLIICPQKFFSAISPLAEWRNQTGIATEIVTTEHLTTDTDIYNFVNAYYHEKGNLSYLLLVGDAKQVPTHKEPYLKDTSRVSDNYYSYLAGDDHYPDILVGRFSAETVQDVEIQVKRTLLYEKSPGLDASWLKKATGIGSDLNQGDGFESDYLHVRKLLKALETSTYSPSNEFFDGSQGDYDANGNPSAMEIADKINEGTGVIFYAGHGTTNFWQTGTITRSVVENLKNTGKYPLIWSAACENGRFADEYCLAEAWLRANSHGQPTGAVAVMMASGAQTSIPPTVTQYKVAELLSTLHEGLTTMGAISISGLIAMNDDYPGTSTFEITDTWVLFGDPALRVRTDVPRKLLASHKGTIGSGRNSYTIKCSTPEGYACISKNGIILGTAALSDGKATLYLRQPAIGDSLLLTITALNYLPYMASIKVTEKPEFPEIYTPKNHSKLQPINIPFSWECIDGGIPESYMFYLGTDNPPTNLINGQTVTSTNFKTGFHFLYNQTYYWKVVPINSFGSASSNVMNFTTVFKPDEEFEANTDSKIDWQNGSQQKWKIDGIRYFDGKQSLRSGEINDDEYSSLVFSYEVQSCDFVSFWSRISSEKNDKLQFIINGKLIKEWSGETDWDFSEFKIDAGANQIEWRYTKNGETSSGSDAAWLDDIHLPVHPSTNLLVPENGSACQGTVFETTTEAENYSTLCWQTDGDGVFAGKNLANALYSPGAIDNQKGSVALQVKLHGFYGCPELERTIVLEIEPLPIVPLPSDTIISNGYAVLLDATTSADMTYLWQPTMSTSATIVIDSIASLNGKKSTNVTITSIKGCSSSKNIMMYFNSASTADKFDIYPNPSDGHFTIKPVIGSAFIEKMILFNPEGKLVWESPENCNIYGTKQLAIKGLKQGTYFLLIDNANGRSSNPIVIR